MGKILLRTEINFKIWGLAGFLEGLIYLYNKAEQIELLRL
jgi:hypothetical protein